LFGALWEPPALEGTLAARTDLSRRFAARDVTPSGKVVHVLSHRRLTISVARCTVDASALRAELPDDYDAARLVEPADFETVGMATLARKILRAGMIE
jgi:adenine-specific DNA glycosylase